MILFIEGPTQEADSMFLRVKRDFGHTNATFHDVSEESGLASEDIMQCSGVLGIVDVHHAMCAKPLFIVRGGFASLYRQATKQITDGFKSFVKELLGSHKLNNTLSLLVTNGGLLYDNYDDEYKEYLSAFRDCVFDLNDHTRKNRYMVVKDNDEDVRTLLYPILEGLTSNK